MIHILILLSLLILSSPLFGQSERPETIIIPVSSLGDVSEVRKQILQNTLEDELKTHFRLIPQQRFEEVQEKVFEELEYEECTEDQCIMMIQEMLQVENVFHLQVIGEGSDTQLSLGWRTLDEKKKETDICLKCGTFQLNDKVRGLVEKLVGGKKVEPEPVVVQDIPKQVEPKVVKTNESIKIIQTENVNLKSGKFVAVGEYGTILSSKEGTSWSMSEPITDNNLWNVAYGNNKFIAVGDSGTILISTDGENWNEISTNETKHLLDVIFIDNKFIIVGTDGIILTSNDGGKWQKRRVEPKHGHTDIVYGNGKFIGVGFHTRTVLVSSDGIKWSYNKIKNMNVLRGLTFGNNLFIAVGDRGTIITSRDTLSWHKQLSGINKKLNSVTYGNGVFVIVGRHTHVLYSTDGVKWKQTNDGLVRSETSPFAGNGVTYGNQIFVVVSGNIYFSKDGIKWNYVEEDTGTDDQLYGVIYAQ